MKLKKLLKTLNDDQNVLIYDSKTGLPFLAGNAKLFKQEKFKIIENYKVLKIETGIYSGELFITIEKEEIK